MGVLAPWLLLGVLQTIDGEGLRSDSDPLDRPAITRATQLWGLTQADKNLPHRLQIEGRVSHFDPQWKALWLETDDVGVYLPLGDSPPLLRTGQRVRLEGLLVPSQGLSAESVKVTVLAEEAPVIPLETAGRINDVSALRDRVVVVDGYVAAQQSVDAEHLRLALIVDDRPVIGWIRPDNPQALPDWTGKRIRMQALYSPRLTPTKTEATIELWCDREADVRVLGPLADSPLFDLSCTPIDQLHRQSLGARVRVRGTVADYLAGSFVVVRDSTGQVLVRSSLAEKVPFGAEIEAVGEVAVEGPKWVLQRGLYRKSPATGSAENPASLSPPPDSIERIRQLSIEQAAAGVPVKISGLVTWSMPDTDFFFLQDVSGGIRVRFDPRQLAAPRLGKYLDIEGMTVDGGFVPAVALRAVRDRGSMSPPEGRSITFEQAISGKEDGQWVVMRGFIQRIESEGDWRWIHVTTPGGDFVGLLQSPVNLMATSGSLVRVQGVCEATIGANGLPAGVMLRVPFIHSIAIEDDAPADPFDLSVRSIRSLRRLGSARDLLRVRLTGTVLHSLPGRMLYVQDGDAAMPLLTHQQLPLQPGDRVDAVGILGWMGTRVVLREAVCRLAGREKPPEPLALADPARLEPALDARLVSLTGTLIDVGLQADHTRLTLQSGGTLFEATLRHKAGETEAVPAPDSRLRLTGLYHLGFDESRQARSFTLELRTADDIAVVQRPRLWTVGRALAAAGILGGAALLGLGWITALRRRMQRQTLLIRRQLERQSRLEAEVHRAARLESLGALAGGIAHDFNNILTIILANLGLMRLEKGLSASALHCVEEIEHGAMRARALTRQLLTFAKGGDPVCAPLVLPDFVKDVVARALHGSPVRCDYSIATDLWPVLADKDQLAQALQSLVLNAVQAMPRGGLLLVILGNETKTGTAHKTLGPGRHVRMVLADTGEGIAPDVLPRIFEPYFSTRRTGSGLGLATVYSIVKRHNGAIEAESKLGEGTKFTLWLPAAEPAKAATPVPAAPLPAAPIPVPPAARRARVLLMDDEVSIQRVMTHVLQHLGLEVTAVSDGGAALREFSQARHTGQPFALILLDLTVPGGMGGREVIELIRKLDARVPAIVSSGYSDDPVMANFRQYGFQAVVQKPFDVAQISAVVNQLLVPAAGAPDAT